jgi:hypothetical protein
MRPYRKDPARVEKRLAKWNAMAALFRQGKETREIAEIYGCTHQYISHCLKRVGVGASDGGQRVKVERERERKRLRAHRTREATSLRKWGCSYDEYLSIKLIPRVARAFVFQRNRARGRGVEWRLTLSEWWTIWRESGFWEQRGLGLDRYCMCRFGDSGPYAVGNVYIATNAQNLQDLLVNKPRYWERKAVA